MGRRAGPVFGAAGVDAGLVMHYFESKERLFRAVMNYPRDSGGVNTEGGDGGAAGQGGGLADHRAGAVAGRAVLDADLPGGGPGSERGIGGQPSLARCDHPRAGRGAAGGHAQAAMVLGVIVVQPMLKLEELAEATPEQVIELLRKGLRLLTRADEAGAAEAEADEAEPERRPDARD